MTPAPRARSPRLLLLSMYPLDRGLWGPTVRITHLRDALGPLVDLDVIAGYRGARRSRLAAYALRRHGLRGLAGIYVESSTFLPAEADIAFLALARALGIPVLTYFRDAYQLFPEYFPITSPRRWLQARAFLPAMRALAAVSSSVATPTAGLAHALFGSRAGVLLLPPGSPSPVGVVPDSGADQLLFVGDGLADVQGGPALVEAVGRARAAGARLGLTMVTPRDREPPGIRPDWLRVIHAEGSEIHALLPQVVATVIPRAKTPYNDLALPIKLFEYLSYGRPMLVTNCDETERLVRQADCGVVTGDSPDAMADGIAALAGQSEEDRLRMGLAAEGAARAASWHERAREVLVALGIDAATGAAASPGAQHTDEAR